MKQSLLLITLLLLNVNRTQAQATPVASPTGKFLIISDIHFNPFCDPQIIGKLVQADYTSWQSIFESSGDSLYGYYDSDTYYRLFKSGLQAMQAQNAMPDMIVINGDFLCHSFGTVYQQRTGNYNLDSMYSFVRKTTSFVFLMLRQYFPNTPVLPVLGNNDDYCGDYHIQPNGPFLSFFAKQVQPLFHGMRQDNFMNTFSTGGYYKVAMPWDSTHLFIALNTIFFSPNYNNYCNPADTTQAGWDEMAWLSNTLADCAATGKKVWLSYHIPPGMDIYASKNSCATGGATGMWQQAYNDTFIALVNRYSSSIQGNFAGHTHMDEFRLISNGSQLTSFVHITPAISPIFNNNPAFVAITWNPGRMKLINSVTYRFGGIEPGGTDTWAEEYNYGLMYGMKAITTKTLGKLLTRMGTDAGLQVDYSKYYFVNNPAKSPHPWRPYWCGARYMKAAEFMKCNCSTSPDN